MHAHNDRPDLVGEHPRGDLGQIILFVIFMAVWIVDSFFLNQTDFISKHISLIIRIPLAIIILGVSGYIAFAGHRILFEEERDSPVVITHGVFSRVRHPLYFSVILFYLAFVMATCSIAATVVWVISIFYYNFIASYEEELLVRHLGQEYIAYREEVPRWLPRILPSGKGDNL